MPPKNKFKNQSRSMDSPASAGFVITPSDSAELQAVPRSIYVGVGGDIRVDMVDGDYATGNKTITFVGVQAGTTLPISVTKVYATSTTATSLLGIY